MSAEQEQAAPEVDLAEVEQEQVIEESPQEIEAEQQEEPQQQAPAAEPDEITIMIGDEPVEEEVQAAPDWVRDLRKKNREDQKRIRELEARLAQTQAPAQTQLGKKPILEDFDYDTTAYESALADWFDKKRSFDAQLEAKKHRGRDVQHHPARRGHPRR
jgi:predicted RNase H-like nuclease (RuvC/YqgF family)